MVTTLAAQNPYAQARLAAITQLAVFEAVNACTGRYRPYLGTITAPDGAAAEAAAVAAAHAVLKHYVPGSGTTIDPARAASLGVMPDTQAKADGIAVGEAAAAAMIAARLDDGSAPPETWLPTSTEPGIWQPTPPVFGAGILLHWRNVAPFAIRSSSQFRSLPPPSLQSRRYTRDYNEVMKYGSDTSPDRPQDRTDVARYFAVVGAVPAWNQAVQQISVARGRTLAQNARAFALLNMAISDALVSAIETKYFYQFWRPVTAIRAGAVDGNHRTDADGNWTPLVTTPAFPSYPSAHASASYAARRVAESLFGFGRVDVTLTNPGVPGITLTYRSLAALTRDVDDARVFGGIHFRFDQEAGAWQGSFVAAYTVLHHLRPVWGH
jgi:hypothetical protein